MNLLRRVSQPAARAVNFWQAVSRQSTVAVEPRAQPPVHHQAKGSQPITEDVKVSRVMARITNFPKFLSKGDLLWLFRGCNVSKEDIVYIYDQKYRLRFIQLNLGSMETYRLVHRALATKGRYGGRYLRLTTEGSELDLLNKTLLRYRGRTLLISKAHIMAVTEDVERLFSGYAMDTNHPVKLYRPALQAAPANGELTAVEKVEADTRILVRFKTELEALRALREKQGALCRDRPADLRLIE